MACSICGTIGDLERANTGRDEHFTAPITSLKRHGLGRSSDDLWECPECGAYFLWHDDTAFTGSGNNDEEVLTRLEADRAAIVGGFLRRRGRPAEDVAASAPKLRDLGDPARGLILSYALEKDRELGAALVPRLLDLAVGAPGSAKETWPLDFVAAFAGNVDAKHVAAELSRRPDDPALAELRAQCKRLLCTTCRTAVPPYSTVVARRDAPPAPLDRLLRFDATDELDAWECPECATMFFWTQTQGDEGRVSRIADYAAGPLRRCLRREGELSSYDVEMVLASDRHRSLKIVLGHGKKGDPELIRQLAPRVRAKVERDGGPSWLLDYLQGGAAKSTSK